MPGKRIFTPNWPKWPKKDWCAAWGGMLHSSELPASSCREAVAAGAPGTPWWLAAVEKELPFCRYQTAQPGNKIGLEMDDGGSRPGDIFDVDGTDDDAEARMHPCWEGGRAGSLQMPGRARKWSDRLPCSWCALTWHLSPQPAANPALQLVPKSWVINLICGPGVMQTVDDVRWGLRGNAGQMEEPEMA